MFEEWKENEQHLCDGKSSEYGLSWMKMGLVCNGWTASKCRRGAKAEWPVLWLESVFKHNVCCSEVHHRWQAAEHAQFDLKYSEGETKRKLL